MGPDRPEGDQQLPTKASALVAGPPGELNDAGYISDSRLLAPARGQQHERTQLLPNSAGVCAVQCHSAAMCCCASSRSDETLLNTARSTRPA